jgi:hypothetical protein
MDVDVGAIFSPFVSPSEKVLHSGFLGTVGFPVVVNSKYFFCITERRLCIYRRSFLGSSTYSEVFLEDVVTSEITKPSLLLFITAFWVAMLKPDLGAIRDIAEFYRNFVNLLQNGVSVIYALYLLLWPLLLGTAILTPAYAVLYYLFLRPSLVISVYGSGLKVSTIAMNRNEGALRDIVHDTHLLRNRLQRLDLTRSPFPVRDLRRSLPRVPGRFDNTFTGPPSPP